MHKNRRLTGTFSPVEDTVIEKIDRMIERSFGPAKGSGAAERAFRPDTNKKCPECGRTFAPSKRFPDMCAKCTRLNK